MSSKFNSEYLSWNMCHSQLEATATPWINDEQKSAKPQGTKKPSDLNDVNTNVLSKLKYGNMVGVRCLGILFVSMMCDSLYWFQAILLPAAPILNKSGFTAAHTACWCYSARNSISQYIDETLLGSLRSYFWHSEIAMVTFFYNIFNNSMVDFKLMRQFEQTHTYLSNQSCFGSFYLLFLPYLFLPIYPNTFDEVTRHQPKFLSKLFHYWSYNLRVARNFSGLPPLSKETRFTPPSLHPHTPSPTFLHMDCFH